MSRRVNHPDGSFAGTLTATVETSYFLDFYGTFSLGHDGAAGLWRDDGTLLVRHSLVVPAVAGSSDANSPIRYIFPKPVNGTYEFVSPVDGVTRILSYRRLADYPMVVELALGRDEQLVDWRIDATEHLFATVLVTLVMGLIGFRLMTQMRLAAIADRASALATAANNENLTRLSRHLSQARDLAERASRAKSRFLAGMSHELRTPLNGILGYAQLLHMEGDLNPKQADRVDAMLVAGKHLLQMITCVLDLSEIESEHIQLQSIEFDLQPVAEACLDLIRPTAVAKGLALSIAVAPDTRRDLISDPVRLRQVLLNLLGNAAKFTGKGSIELRLRPAEDAAKLRIEVADTGPRIPAEKRSRLFQDFERLDADAGGAIEGAGLGLALSARLASLMGGRLGYDDNPGGGSVFWLELPWKPQATPIAASAPAFDAHGAEPVPQAVRALHVLVVDDVQINRDIACSFLRAAGHEASCAEDGIGAVAAAAGTDFDIVLMDVRMPRMDGLEATRHIRSLGGKRGQVPIVAVTAQAFTDQVAACHAAGMDGHLAKPFDMGALLTAVARAVAARPRPDVTPGPAGPPASVSGALAVPSIDRQLPVLDPLVFERTAGFLTPEMFASSMRTLVDFGETILRGLREPNALARSGDELAEAAHTLAGSAGMFGFKRLAATGRSFEQAVRSGAAGASALADELRAAVEAALREIQDR